ncbi:hypothetical protein, partial [uncultured Gammaproteobacteria bacterium]
CQLLVVVLVPILVRLADLAMLALLATTGLVLLYLVIGGIGMLVIWASVVTVFMQDSAMLCALRAGVFVALRI